MANGKTTLITKCWGYVVGAYESIMLAANEFHNQDLNNRLNEIFCLEIEKINSIKNIINNKKINKLIPVVQNKDKYQNCLDETGKYPKEMETLEINNFLDIYKIDNEVQNGNS
ncbi:hypothetical protein SSYRP_v1c04490 [Spiroplasma syrphidicola EA-1]|uniref:Uncharacterized protein n=1 Tax=Spiroplasma syrphidicola EA-1 TaxID=1276229 RepID=R4ULA9_9MOLU|nr:hypothetical protein [Spiroplasma syrphidicola]AGM26041.1 hypothetical protein SSYRP_v1c04490 [Spiroplasma syrphidicola EA-1]